MQSQKGGKEVVAHDVGFDDKVGGSFCDLRKHGGVCAQLTGTSRRALVRQRQRGGADCLPQWGSVPFAVTMYNSSIGAQNYRIMHSPSKWF